LYGTRKCYLTLLQNKTLSDQRTDTILTLQGVGWLKRKAISIATITLYVKHTTEDGVERIVIDQTISGGIPASTEDRTLNWAPRENNDQTFGEIITKSRRVKADELDIPFLKEGWTADTLELGLIHSFTESNTPKSGTTWTANQVSSVIAKTLTLSHPIFARPGDSKKSTEKGDILDMSSLLGRRRRTLRPFSSMTIVSDSDLNVIVTIR